MDDPIRKFLWGIGNGTSEENLCTNLETFYHQVCPLADVLDKEICNDYKNAYIARCSPSSNRLTQEGTFLYLASVLIFCLSMASIFKAKQILFIPDSAITIIIGMMTGFFFVISSKGKHRFNEQVFFEILLPFIIFESGYNIDKGLLKKNIKVILTLAVIGTLISFFVIAGIMYVGNHVLETDLSFLDIAMFASLISSTDPVAIVNVFSSLGVDPKLYTLVFGESTLNDGVSVALYSSMKHFYANPDVQGTDAVIYVIGSFFWISIGSVLNGIVFGLLTALFWKKKGFRVFRHPVLETLVFLTCALVPYYFADMFEWSGVVSIVSGSMTLSIYAHPNLSSTAQLHVVFLVECCARLFEAVMFGYLGTQMVVSNEHMVWNGLAPLSFLAVLIARAFATFPVISLSNCCSQRDQTKSNQVVPFKHQIVIWFSGLRGALCFALAVTVPEYDTVLKQGSKHTGEILACTCLIIVLNVFIMGGLSPFLLTKLDVLTHEVNAITSEQTISEAEPGLIDKFHTHFMIPMFTLKRAEAVTDTNTEILISDGYVHVEFDDMEETPSNQIQLPVSRMVLSRKKSGQPISPMIGNQFLEHSLLDHNVSRLEE